MYGYSVVCFYLGVMMGRLGAPFAVFGTMTRTGIDDRASIERFITEFFTESSATVETASAHSSFL
jgi:hypothetical protein